MKYLPSFFAVLLLALLASNPAYAKYKPKQGWHEFSDRMGFATKFLLAHYSATPFLRPTKRSAPLKK